MGARKAWKVKGRKSSYKMYQEFCREKYRAGFVPDGRGGWMNASALSDSNIRSGYEALFRRLG